MYEGYLEICMYPIIKGQVSGSDDGGGKPFWRETIQYISPVRACCDPLPLSTSTRVMLMLPADGTAPHC